jgi:hypothetical protein
MASVAANPPSEDQVLDKALDRLLPRVVSFGDPSSDRPAERRIPVDLTALRHTFEEFDAFAITGRRLDAAASIASMARAQASVLKSSLTYDVRPEPLSDVQRYFRIRTADLSGDQALHQCLCVINDVAIDIADAPIAGSDLTRIVSAMSEVINSFSGPLSSVSASADPPRPIRTIEEVWLRRWIVGHQLHAMLNIYAAYALVDAIRALRACDYHSATRALHVAARIVEGFPGARAHALALPAVFYSDVLRPTMLPPLTSTPLTGTMHVEYRGYRRRLEQVMELLPQSSVQLAAMQPQLALARERLLDADLIDSERHVTSVEPLVGDSRSLIQSGRSTENALAALRRIRHRRADQVARYVRFPDRIARVAGPGEWNRFD